MNPIEIIWMLEADILIKLIKALWLDGILKSKNIWEICDLWSWIPHFSQELAKQFPQLTKINCVDPVYSELEEVRQTIDNIISNEIKYNEDSVYSNFIAGTKVILLRKFQTILEKDWLNKKLKFHNSLDNLPENSQSIVFANFLINSNLFPRTLLEQIKRVLKDDGKLVFIDYKSNDQFEIIKNIIREKKLTVENKSFTDKEENYEWLVIWKDSLEEIVKSLNEWIPEKGNLFEIELEDFWGGEKFKQQYLVIPKERIIDRRLSDFEIETLEKAFYDNHVEHNYYEALVEEIKEYREIELDKLKEIYSIDEWISVFLLSNLIISFKNNNIGSPKIEEAVIDYKMTDWDEYPIEILYRDLCKIKL